MAGSQNITPDEIRALADQLGDFNTPETTPQKSEGCICPHCALIALDDASALLRVLAAIAEQVDARIITLQSAREFTKASAQIRALDAGINELAAIAALITEGTK